MDKVAQGHVFCQVLPFPTLTIQSVPHYQHYIVLETDRATP